MKKMVFIVGPTASGKTALSIELAKKLNTEIISADSMQIYKGMDIGTAKPTIFEMKNIKHHMIDVIDPKSDYSVAQYKSDAMQIIRRMHQNNQIPMIVGGTGLYIDALIKNINFSKGKKSEEIREHYFQLAKMKSNEYLHERLKEKDQKAAAKVHPNNLRRVIRYLEILESYDGSIDEYQKEAVNEGNEESVIFMLVPERRWLYDRIELRINQMIQQGLIDETKELLNSQVSHCSTALQAIGYKEVVAYLRGYCTKNEMIDVLKKNTRRYAKRQYTWFKRYPKGISIKMDQETKQNEIISIMLKELEQRQII